MSNLSMVEATLPPGFRFHPRDEELIWDYLMKKVTRCQPLPQTTAPILIEVDLNKCEPWDIPETASVGGKEWYFYSQRDRKYATGLRTNRATVSGYWKATGKDRPVLRRGALVGMRKTLVFYQGRAPKGRKTDWVMHEFRLEGPLAPPKVSSAKADWVLCRVFHKTKEGPSAKQGMGSSRSYEDTSSSSLPPLVDPYNITFDPTQTQPNNDIQYEQVPCFSIFTSSSNYQTNQTYPSQIATHAHVHPNLPNHLSSSSRIITSTLPTFGAIPAADVATYLNPSLSCDKKAIKAVFSHLNKMDNYKDDLDNFGDGISDQSFLSCDVALPNMWYH